MAGDASDFYRLADDLAKVPAKSIPALRSGMTAAGKAVERSWQNSARQVHGGSSHFYPESIDSEILPGFSSVTVEIGPNSAKKQGFLGKILEQGGERSPAYLLGLSALTGAEGPTERIIDQAMNPLFP